VFFKNLSKLVFFFYNDALCVGFTVPGHPQDVKVKPINSTAIHVQWKPPAEKNRNGIIRGYHIHVQETKEEVKYSFIN
jgi:netrin-G3 ligand